jgi:hypothetical protein
MREKTHIIMGMIFCLMGMPAFADDIPPEVETIAPCTDNHDGTVNVQWNEHDWTFDLNQSPEDKEANDNDINIIVDINKKDNLPLKHIFESVCKVTSSNKQNAPLNPGGPSDSINAQISVKEETIDVKITFDVYL